MKKSSFQTLRGHVVCSLWEWVRGLRPREEKQTATSFNWWCRRRARTAFVSWHIKYLFPVDGDPFYLPFCTSSPDLRWTEGRKAGRAGQPWVSEFREVSVKPDQATPGAPFSLWDFNLWFQTVSLSLFDPCRKLGCKNSLRQLWERESLFLVGHWPLEAWLGSLGQSSEASCICTGRSWLQLAKLYRKLSYSFTKVSPEEMPFKSKF